MAKVINRGLAKANNPVLSKVSLIGPVMIFPHRCIKNKKNSEKGNAK